MSSQHAQRAGADDPEDLALLSSPFARSGDGESEGDEERAGGASAAEEGGAGSEGDAPASPLFRQLSDPELPADIDTFDNDWDKGDLAGRLQAARLECRRCERSSTLKLTS